MKIERVMEILDPEHRENYDSIDIVNEACRIGIEALKKQKPLKLIPPTDGECEISMCPNCREPIWSGEFRKYFGAEYNYCPRCGQALKSDAELRERLKEYEDLEEQGLLVKLPCRVGDTVHAIINGAIVSDVVDRIEINESCQKVSTKKHSWLCDLSKIYPTAEAAEAALKEVEK